MVRLRFIGGSSQTAAATAAVETFLAAFEDARPFPFALLFRLVSSKPAGLRLRG